MKEKTVLVVGGGAAGMMAALTAAEAGHRAILLEKNGKTGRKLALTGNGRCNVTNANDIETLLDHVVSNRNFLYSAIYGFSNEDMIRFLEESGLETKIEPGMRVFPVTDRAADVIRALERRMREAGVQVRTGAAVKDLWIEYTREDGVRTENAAPPREKAGNSGIACPLSVKEGEPGAAGSENLPPVCRGVILSSGERVRADVTILAAGGKSLPGTGSNGDGYLMAEAAGHTIRPLRPALTPFVVNDGTIRSLQGRTFRDVKLTVYGRSGRRLFEDRGDVLFTHFGISGPLVLTASSYCASELYGEKSAPDEKNAGPSVSGHEASGGVTAALDFFPDRSPEDLEKALLEAIKANGKKQISTVFAMIAPKPLVPVLLQKHGIAADIHPGELPRKDRQAVLRDLKSLSLAVSGLRGFREAMITQGGVCVDEVDPVIMESLLVRGLRFAGEILDMDALTGGYNLQIAWSTGRAAGTSI